MSEKIKKSLLSFPVMFQKTEEIEGSDGRFTKVKIWLMHLGQNFNGSIFEKSVVDEAIPSLAYIPIVGFLEKNKIGEDDFSDHRYIITKDENGLRRKYIGSAYGVILSSDENNAHYEERICDDGETRTFLVVDGVIWNMFEDSCEIINRDLIKFNSMELFDNENAIDGYEDENGIFHFTKFSFRAACILGSEYQPAMINSTIEVQFTVSDFVKNIQSELNDKLSIFTKLVNKKLDKPSISENYLIKENNQGGTRTMPNTEFTQTVMEQFSDISRIVSQQEIIKDRWGDAVPRFYLADIQDDEVIVVDRKNDYTHYGYKFTIDGDKPVIDFTNGCRKKIRYENYEDGVNVPDSAFDFGTHIAECEEIAFNKVIEAETKVTEAEKAKNEAETNYTKVKIDYDTIKPKYDEFVAAEEKRIAEEVNAAKDAKFAEYEVALADNADFTALKEQKDELSVDEIENKCAIIFAKINLKNTSKKDKSTDFSKTLVIPDDGESEGFVETKYGNIRVSK